MGFDQDCARGQHRRHQRPAQPRCVGPPDSCPPPRTRATSSIAGISRPMVSVKRLNALLRSRGNGNACNRTISSSGKASRSGAAAPVKAKTLTGNIQPAACTELRESDAANQRDRRAEHLQKIVDRQRDERRRGHATGNTGDRRHGKGRNRRCNSATNANNASTTCVAAGTPNWMRALTSQIAIGIDRGVDRRQQWITATYSPIDPARLDPLLCCLYGKNLFPMGILVDGCVANAARTFSVRN